MVRKVIVIFLYEFAQIKLFLSHLLSVSQK